MFIYLVFNQKFMRRETVDILKAWSAISVAFAILLSGGVAFDIKFLTAFLISAFTVGIGFLFHELAHRTLARNYGAKAEFRSFDQMLILAILMSFFGFILAAPGAVFIRGHVNKEKYGKISAVGPMTNIILSVIFLVVFLLGIQTLNILAFYGKTINAWLALFNMIPFGNFDGVKILMWNKAVYGLMVAVALALVLIPISL